jgi:NAD(P)-dependent dehydrogenase (short-subunit alcohol dehydrogenase family)
MDGYHAGFTHRSFFDVMRRRLGTSVRYASGLPTATSRSFRNGHCAIDPETTSRKPLMNRVTTLPEAGQRLALLRAEVGDDVLVNSAERALGRDGHPGDVAGAVLYFAGGASEFVTGQSLTVDGGQLFG